MTSPSDPALTHRHSPNPERSHAVRLPDEPVVSSDHLSGSTKGRLLWVGRVPVGQDPSTNKSAWFGAYVVAAILALVPFHALLSVWVGSSLGIYDLARVWKEVLLVGLGAITICLLWRNRSLWASLRSQLVLRLVGAYFALHFLMGVIALVIGRVSLKALAYGVTVNLRFLAFFLVALVIAARLPWIKLHWQKILLVPAAIVVAFGLLQVFVLPNNFLDNIGYGPDTIPAHQLVDRNSEQVRIQSTLRGPNALGAYLVVILSAVAALLISIKNRRRLRWALGSLAAGTLIVLGHTYSRSAYIGAALALVVVGWLAVRSVNARRMIVVGAACLLLAFGGLAWILRDNDTVQNILFHTNEHSLAPRSSNQERASALQSGLGDVVTEPLGRGPGTAGPASVYNYQAPARIAENYYLQLGQEVGWIGLGLFIAIGVALGRRLLRAGRDPLATALFASLIGISIINLLSHAWTDDTLSLLWWGMAGLLMGSKLPRLL